MQTNYELMLLLQGETQELASERSLLERREAFNEMNRHLERISKDKQNYMETEEIVNNALAKSDIVSFIQGFNTAILLLKNS